MNPKGKRLNPCQDSDVNTHCKLHFIRRPLDIFTLVWLAFGILYFVRA